MVIAKKPKKIDVEALINKGGSIAKDKNLSVCQDIKEKSVVLRIPSSMIDSIDKMLKTRLLRMPRHTWILEAIAEKIERENEKFK